MVCFMPGFVTESERADMKLRDQEKDRLEGLYPADAAKVEQALAAWRATHPAPHAATLADVADHIDHIRKVAGIDHLGLGSDFDGFHGATIGLEDVSCYPALLAELLRRGYTNQEIKQVAGLNLLRVLRQAERVSAQLRRQKP